MPDLKVSKISDGTVIDHIPAGRGLDILSLLGLNGDSEKTVSLLMNVKSSKMKRKDIVKVEGRKLKEREVKSVAILAPEATVNIIEDYEVLEKDRLDLPQNIQGFLSCPNPQCVTNTDEPLKAAFKVREREPVLLQCEYCERKFTSFELDI
ncbi:MAG: aspartate carbamoyltransferase regulatory subunit [Candidatus Aenigmatarchaeota archaeon]